MTRKTLIIMLVLIAAGSILLMVLNHFKNPEIGVSFNREADLFLFESKIGFVFLGKFDQKFPGTVTGVERSENSITFKLKNGAIHNYDNFAGYDLKVVRLETKSGEAVYVFRSIDK